jgi:hypothetical protein
MVEVLPAGDLVLEEGEIFAEDDRVFVAERVRVGELPQPIPVRPAPIGALTIDETAGRET